MKKIEKGLIFLREKKIYKILNSGTLIGNKQDICLTNVISDIYECLSLQKWLNCYTNHDNEIFFSIMYILLKIAQAVELGS